MKLFASFAGLLLLVSLLGIGVAFVAAILAVPTVTLVAAVIALVAAGMALSAERRSITKDPPRTDFSAKFFALGLALFILAPVVMFAQADTTYIPPDLPDISSWEGLILYLLPGVTALLIYLLKLWLYDKIVNEDGSITWESKVIPKEMLPWLGPVLGVLIGAIVNWLGGLELSLLAAAVASAFSTVIYEVFKPITRAIGKAAR